MVAPPKGPRVSAAQTTLLVVFMEQHLYLARGATSLLPTQQQPRRPPRQQQPLEDAAFRAAAEYARQGQLAEASNVESVSFHWMLLGQNRQHHQQLLEELRAFRVVQQQLAVEMRGLREATSLIATTLRQLVAALAHGLREPPQP
ncbi:hypothetical protein HPB49_017068 [Dermacentor silvarum]|uniref:Uncharacterized protein n=1 Tax=Dermacentor silvarum TaxID=543639 RepID=A0ACB8DJV9_DERSI|nr:hypothetical protein HPB49_017068 [Dermacentor silvarum]